MLDENDCGSDPAGVHDIFGMKVTTIFTDEPSSGKIDDDTLKTWFFAGGVVLVILLVKSFFA